MSVEQLSLPAGTFSLLRTLAGLTSTKIDDLLVDLLEAVLSDPAISDWFAGKVAAGRVCQAVREVISRINPR